MVVNFSVRSFGDGSLVVHTPRRDNAAADAAANRALDQGTFEEVYASEQAKLVEALATDGERHLGLVFSFDGASRRNPGAAAEGNCAWWGTWKENHFNEIGMLMCRGRRIGTQTNNVAEARGLDFAVKAALHFWFWLVESCAQAVETRTL